MVYQIKKGYVRVFWVRYYTIHMKQKHFNIRFILKNLIYLAHISTILFYNSLFILCFNLFENYYYYIHMRISATAINKISFQKIETIVYIVAYFKLNYFGKNCFLFDQRKKITGVITHFLQIIHKEV